MKSADILIVDDDPQVAKSIARAIKPHDFSVYSAQNGVDALNLFAKINFKVIVSDVKMSGMHGFGLLDSVHEISPEITRMVLSGHADVELILKLVNQKGIDKYLIKPWENSNLVSAISRCIEIYDLGMGLKRSENREANLNSVR